MILRLKTVQKYNCLLNYGVVEVAVFNALQTRKWGRGDQKLIAAATGQFHHVDC